MRTVDIEKGVGTKVLVNNRDDAKRLEIWVNESEGVAGVMLDHNLIFTTDVDNLSNLFAKYLRMLGEKVM